MASTSAKCYTHEHAHNQSSLEVSSCVLAPVQCVQGEPSEGLSLGSSTSWEQGPAVMNTEGMMNAEGDDDGCTDELATKKTLKIHEIQLG